MIRIQHKMKYKNQIIENEKFWETVLLLTLKMQDFVQFFLVEKPCQISGFGIGTRAITGTRVETGTKTIGTTAITGTRVETETKTF